MSPVLYMCYGNKMRVKFRQSWVNIEKNNRFVDRVLILSVPAALVLVFLAVLDIISPLLAVFSYAAIVMFNLIFLLPVTVELQQLRRYISSLASGGEVRDDAVELLMNARITIVHRSSTIGNTVNIRACLHDMQSLG